jgi:bacillopeptidase F (M6 metalloprotease family)
VDAEALGDGVAGEAAFGAGAEQRITALAGAFVEPGPQYFLDAAAERDGAMLAALTLAADGGADVGGDVVTVQARELGDAQTGLDGQRQHGLVSSSLPASWVGCCQ